jgi:uncharacterized cupin superfamily protein
VGAEPVNWNDLEPNPRDRDGYGHERWNSLSRRLGARDLGISHVVVPPGKMACPPHEHSREEELFVVLAGSGEWIGAHERFPLRPGDAVSALPATGAHTIEAGPEGIEYLAISATAKGDWCWYPESGKVLVEGLYLTDAEPIGNYYFRDPRAGRFGENRDRAE